VENKKCLIIYDIKYASIKPLAKTIPLNLPGPPSFPLFAINPEIKQITKIKVIKIWEKVDFTINPDINSALNQNRYNITNPNIKPVKKYL